MPTPNKEWIKEFARMWDFANSRTIRVGYDQDDIKSFIQTLLDKAEAKSFKEGQESKKAESSRVILKNILLDLGNYKKELEDRLSELKKD